MFSCEFCEISKNTFFTKHLRTTASVLILFWLIPKRFKLLKKHWDSKVYATFISSNLVSTGSNKTVSMSLTIINEKFKGGSYKKIWKRGTVRKEPFS